MSKRVCIVASPDLFVLLDEALKETDFSDWTVFNSSPSTITSNTVISKIKGYLNHMNNIRNCDVVCFVFVDSLALRLAKFAKAIGKKTIFFWIGSDVYHLRERKFGIAPKADLHLADGEELVNELSELGIKAESVLIAPNIADSVAQMPQEHAIMLNIPDDRLEFYNYDDAINLIKKFPHTKFVVVRSNSPELYDFPNVDFRGIVAPDDMDAVYNDISIIWRFPKHDSLSLASMEGLIKGKYIVSHFPFPMATQVDTFEDSVQELQKILKTEVKVNNAGRIYALANFTQEASGKEFARQLNGIIETSSNQTVS